MPIYGRTINNDDDIFSNVRFPVYIPFVWMPGMSFDLLHIDKPSSFCRSFKNHNLLYVLRARAKQTILLNIGAQAEISGYYALQLFHFYSYFLFFVLGSLRRRRTILYQIQQMNPRINVRQRKPWLLLRAMNIIAQQNQQRIIFIIFICQIQQRQLLGMPWHIRLI